VIPVNPFRRLSLGLVSLLMGLLALGPFLHAHYGASQATGFHVNGLQAVAMAQTAGMASDSPVLSPPSEQESPAVGVVTSLPRWETDSFSPDTAHVPLLSEVVSGGLQRLMLAAFWPSTLKPIDSRIFKAGFPPPAHAPPTPL
jgi:hypothetical protein